MPGRRSVLACMLGQEPRRPADEALVAAAGPIASGLLTGAFLGAWFVSEFIPDAVGEAASQVALALAALNALLALLNLLPVYPLDGGRILRAVLWGVSHDQRRAARGVALTSRVAGDVERRAFAGSCRARDRTKGAPAR